MLDLSKSATGQCDNPARSRFESLSCGITAVRLISIMSKPKLTACAEGRSEVARLAFAIGGIEVSTSKALTNLSWSVRGTPHQPARAKCGQHQDAVGHS